MARTLKRTSATKQAERLKALARAKRLLNFKRKHEPVIPDRVLKQLAKLNLPPNPWVYDVCLRELLSPSGGVPAMMAADDPATGERLKEGVGVKRQVAGFQ